MIIIREFANTVIITYVFDSFYLIMNTCNGIPIKYVKDQYILIKHETISPRVEIILQSL